MNYIFGPVPSRRLGMSLGVDIVPLKTCTFDCVYCQLGSAPGKYIQRKSYVPKEEVLDELREAMDGEAGRADFITFSGSGEPTLNSDIGEIIHQIKTFTPIPVAVISNGSLLYRDGVRRDLSEADLVVPSLDAVTDATFRKINRPDESFTMDLIIEGLRKFTQEFAGKIWLEIVIVKGINDEPEELKQVAELARSLKVDKIHLNTVARPPAEEFAHAIAADEMRNIASMFDDRVEVIVDFDKIVEREAHETDMESEVIALMRRRACTVEDISNSLGIHTDEAARYVNRLRNNGSVKRMKYGGKWYYELVPGQ